jgi:hypothetical protein
VIEGTGAFNIAYGRWLYNFNCFFIKKKYTKNDMYKKIKLEKLEKKIEKI